MSEFEDRARSALAEQGIIGSMYLPAIIAGCLAFHKSELTRIAEIIDGYEPISADAETFDAECYAAERIAARIRAIGDRI